MSTSRLAAALVAASFLPFLGSDLPGQSRWAETVPHVRTTFGNLGALLADDLDGDGDVELLGSDRTSDRYLRNEGSGAFRAMAASALPAAAETRAWLSFDADGDGDRDLLRGRGVSGPLPDAFYRNDGAGRFADASAALPAIAGETLGAAAGDVDGDGDPDLLVWQDTGLRMLENDGTGAFRDVSATALPQSPTARIEDAVFGDFDGDGDPDLALADRSTLLGSTNLFYRNDGTGRFVDVTARWYGGVLAPIADRLVVADFDGDGDPDVLLQQPVGVLALENDGAAGFTVAPGTPPPLPQQGLRLRPRVADFDGDGDPDLLFAFSAAPNVLWRNDGGWRFTDVSGRLPGLVRARRTVRFADFDGDGDADIVETGRRSLLLANDGSGAFELATPFAAPGANGSEFLAAGDVDGDGAPDLVGSAEELLRNDGWGGFAAERVPMPGELKIAGVLARFPVLGDVDGDGDPDLLVGMSGPLPRAQQNLLLLNDGGGGFTDVTAARVPASRDVTLDSLLFDADGDGDLDAFAANDGANALWRNDGAGVFVDDSGRLPPNAALTRVAAAADVDGDARPDLLLADDGAVRLWLARRSGYVDVSAGLPAAAAPRTVALADLDGDGDVDALVGTTSGLVSWRNTGLGAMIPVPGSIPPTVQRVDRLLVADVDGDGDADVLTRRQDVGVRSRTLLNDGSGTFVDATEEIPDELGRRGVAVLDADADGDRDVVRSSFGLGWALYRDRARQLAPVLPPARGRVLSMDLWIEPGFATTTSVAGLLVGTRPMRTPLPPFGVLGLDPAAAVALPPVTSAPPGGAITLRIVVPGLASLGGAPFVAQAVVADGRRVRLTNAVVDVIR